MNKANQLLAEYNLPADSSAHIVIPRNGRNFAVSVNGREIATDFKSTAQARTWAKKYSLPIASCVATRSL